MKTCVLYSGGKDSSLMAVMLQRLGYDVELVTINFGVFDSFKPAAQSAASLGFKHHILSADRNILEKATRIIINDGFPNNGINYIHKETLNIAADNYDIVADGTRRDDRIPKLEDREINSLESRKNIEYINLRGFGHKTINALSENLFIIKRENTNMDNNSDYEIEIRYLIDQLEGENSASNIFPQHIQSRVTGWKKSY